MTLAKKIQLLPLSGAQRILREDNLQRLEEFKKLPADQRPAPAPPRRADFKPAELLVSILDLAGAPAEAPGQPPPVSFNRKEIS